MILDIFRSHKLPFFPHRPYYINGLHTTGVSKYGEDFLFFF